ncbi:hypothetical protein LJC32_05625 [Oscillospiraceae bacterium OttesenSCG-928-F05]|nr:hypothetical protein [Oscillospiraceae bacterium OttesenSCG-928-F05]
MLKCPGCGREFPDGTASCMICQLSLQPENDVPLWPKTEEGEQVKGAYLTTVGSGIEGEILVSLLHSLGIPVARILHDESGIGMGALIQSALGHAFTSTDLYVPEPMLPFAREALDADIAEDNQL